MVYLLSYDQGYIDGKLGLTRNRLAHSTNADYDRGYRKGRAAYQVSRAVDALLVGTAFVFCAAVVFTL